MHRSFRILALMGILVLALAAPAHATTMWGDVSTEGLGGFQADLSYEATSDTEAVLTVQIINLSTPDLGGYITGFLLNNPFDAIQAVSQGEEFPEAFELLGGDDPDNGENGAPYGKFDFGAALGGKFLGGGDPKPGIVPSYGYEATVFTFHLVGTDLGTLTSDSFALTYSSSKKTDYQAAMVVRFRGFEDGGSDKTMSQGDVWLMD